MAWLALLLLARALAVPSATYPFNAQFPPVARPGQAYSYQLPQDTFSTADPTGLSYAISGLPDWLAFDVNTLALTGTPPDSLFDGTSDQASVSFTVTATDSTGSADSPSTLVVTKSPPPQIQGESVDQILQAIGPAAGANTVVLTPGEDFAIEFPKDLFSPAAGGPPVLGLLGLSASHTPLPNWVHYGVANNTFSGTAPAVHSTIAPAQAFAMALYVSDVQGFSSGSVEFAIVTGAHALTTTLDESKDTANATAGSAFEYKLPLDRLALDGAALTLANVSGVQINDTTWLAVKELTISGTPPKDLANTSQPVLVTVQDQFGDNLSYTLAIAVGAGNTTLFKQSSLPPVNATLGQLFVYNVGNVLESKTANVTVDTGADWLRFETSNLTLIGTVPSDFQGLSVDIRASEGGDTQSRTLKVDKSVATTSSSSSATPSATPSSTVSSTPSASATSASPSPTSKPSTPSSKSVAIICGILIPLCVLAALLILYVCYRRTRKSMDKRTISPPVPPEDVEKGPFGAGAAAYGAQAQARAKTQTKTKGLAYADTKELPTPENVQAMNFKKMDDEAFYSGEETQVESDTSFDRDTTTPLAVRDASTPESISTPASARHSWRHSGNDGSGRWQEHKVVGSLATISTDELATMRMVDRSSSNYGGLAISRESSSGIIQTLGQDSDKDVSYQTANSEDYESEEGDVDLRPYRNSRGELTWSQYAAENDRENNGENDGENDGQNDRQNDGQNDGQNDRQASRSQDTNDLAFL